MKIKTLFGVLVLMFASSAHADLVIFEACVNHDGGIDSVGGSECSADGVDHGNLTDNIGADGLGSVIFSGIAGVGPHVVSMFLDWDIDAPDNTFFNEYGAANGAPAPGQSWEIDEPGFVFGDIFGNFVNGTADNSNAVPFGSDDDVSLLLQWDFVLAAGEEAIVTFLLSATEPLAGFFLSHTDPDSNETYYFSSTLEIRDSNGVPEPGTLLLLGAGLLGLGLRRRIAQKH